ncbi:hypothetical protein BTO04_04925 [Polaribacter sp. SA4-10]|uniref:hypothetical protein n=1 Tax=Polaribacter sp. SA4-10 TaxID=754397 RepID=UPI000B3C06F7|nr:hypothetical protein [Polaribacter sp. SA4-10]ARV06084.1 hypothetical protein BTO04_04925 [Polaribacter sp. SA4-10]
MITVKLFGEGCYIHLLDSSDKTVNTYQKIANKMRVPLNEALLDIGFFLKMNSDIQSIHQLIIDSFGGLLPVYPAYIEISFNQKKVAKINLQELISITTLFPLYKVAIINFKNHQFDKGIYLKETVIGCIGVYRLPVNIFSIDLFSFTILHSSFTELPLLINFTYNDTSFKKVKEDCLTKQQKIIIL